MKKTSIFYIILAILIIVGAFGFFFLKQSVGEPSVPRQEDSITYATKEYSFNYPQNWFVRDNSNNINSPYLSISNYDPSLLPPHGGPEDFFKIEIYKLSNASRLPLQTWVEDFVKESPTGSSIVNQREDKIDGHNSLFVNQIVGGGSRLVIYIAREDSVYLVQGGSRLEAMQSVFDEFLQSLHFIYK